MKSIFSHSHICKPKHFLLVAVFVMVNILPQAASAQFTLGLGTVYQEFTSVPKGYPFLIGLNPRIGLDIGRKHHVSIQSNLQYPATWNYMTIDLQGAVVNTFVPKPQISGGLGVVEFSALYSYYFKGKSYTDWGIYASGGPGAAFFVKKLSGIGSSEAFIEQRTDYQLDTRLGAQYHLFIGWLYLEGRFAPTLFSTGISPGEKTQGPLLGFNLGMRYLLNRHPYCTD